MPELIAETLPNTEPRAAAIKALQAEVHAARHAMRWTQNEFARRAGVNGGLLSGILNGKLVSAPAERRVRRFLERLRRQGKLRDHGGSSNGKQQAAGAVSTPLRP